MGLEWFWEMGFARRKKRWVGEDGGEKPIWDFCSNHGWKIDFFSLKREEEGEGLDWMVFIQDSSPLLFFAIWPISAILLCSAVTG